MNVPLVYLCAFSLFLSITLFFYNKGYKGANRFLSGYLFCSSFFLVTQYFFIYSKSAVLIAYFVTGFSSLFFLIGPFAYLYVRSIFRDNVLLSKKDYLHFLSYTIIFIGLLPFFFSSWEHKIFISQTIVDGTYLSSSYNMSFLLPKTINQTLRPLFALFYLALITREFIKNRYVFTSLSHAKAIKIWLGIFYLLFSLTAVFYIVIYLTYNSDKNFFYTNSWFYYIISSVAFFYLAFNFSLVLFPQILYGLPIPTLISQPISAAAETKSTPIYNEGSNPTIENKTPAQPAFFSKEYELDIVTALQNWIADKKYIHPEASLLSISNYTSIPVHHLSYYFNTILKIKYTDWRNTYRIEFAKAHINAGFHKSNTIEALSLESGFTTQATFIKCFKNTFGCTPSDYIKNKCANL